LASEEWREHAKEGDRSPSMVLCLEKLVEYKQVSVEIGSCYPLNHCLKSRTHDLAAVLRSFILLVVFNNAALFDLVWGQLIKWKQTLDFITCLSL